jgi:hypothetical protein
MNSDRGAFRCSLLFFLLILAGCGAASPTPTANPCAEVKTLAVEAFQAFSPGACVTLMPPASAGPSRALWCPTGSALPSTGATLSLIGTVKMLIRRDKDKFDVVGPGASGAMTFTPLIRSGNYLVLANETRLFEDKGGGNYICLVDTLVAQPER